MEETREKNFHVDDVWNVFFLVENVKFIEQNRLQQMNGFANVNNVYVSEYALNYSLLHEINDWV